MHLVSDLPSIMLDRKFRERHFWLGIQWIVAMMIVAFLKEGMVCSLEEIHSKAG